MRKTQYGKYTIFENGTVIGKFGKPIGNTNKKGYTYVTINGKQMLKHRLIWIAFNGSIPDNLEIDHIVPVKNGGTDSIQNLRLVSHDENCNNGISKTNYVESNKSKNIGKHHSDETKEKISKNQINDVKKSKKVGKYNKNLELLCVYDSVHDAARKNNIKASGIFTSIKGKKYNKKTNMYINVNTYKGYKWRYL